MKYGGKEFTPEDVQRIRVMIKKNPHKNRTNISYQVCEEFSWYKPDGKLKDMSCRVALSLYEKHT